MPYGTKLEDWENKIKKNKKKVCYLKKKITKENV